jgi:hypothetical protein
LLAHAQSDLGGPDASRGAKPVRLQTLGADDRP